MHILIIAYPTAIESNLITRRLHLALASLLVVGGFATWFGIIETGAPGVPSAPSPAVGAVLNRTLSTSIDHLSFENQQGRRVALDQYRGRTVLLAPFLTSCQEECPVTTGALLDIEQALVADKLTQKVVIAEVTVDPGRDTPSRMAAYAHMTGSSWPLLTASSPTIARLWHFFGIYYQKVAEGSPPGINWETGQPYTYDVDHSDGFILLNAQLHERFFAGGLVRVSSVPARIRSLLDAQGVQNLRHPRGGSWTIADALNAIGWSLGRAVPPS
jgi:protein SCO1/2